MNWPVRTAELLATYEEQGLLIEELQEELTVEHARRKSAERLLRQILESNLTMGQIKRLVAEHFGEG